jgi:hypothetical protein
LLAPDLVTDLGHELDEPVDHSQAGFAILRRHLVDVNGRALDEVSRLEEIPIAQ